MQTSRPAIRLSRRELLAAGGLALGALALPRLGARAAQDAYALPQAARKALGESPLVYVSPLKSDGGESRCHGEVWFTTDGDDVLLATGKDAWKARAVAKGLERARLWVGDFGPVGKAGDRYRAAPSFLARVRRDSDPAAFEGLMRGYAEKYADEWGKWGPRFRKGYDDGSRVLLRYTPIAP